MSAQKKFAVFDIDGTLIRWQLYHAVVDKLAKSGALGEGAHQEIQAARMKWKRREDNDGFAEYEAVLISQYEKAFQNLSTEEFDKVTDQVIEEYKDQVYTYTRDLIAKLKQEDYLLLAISGSQHELVEKIATHYGFSDYIATKYTRNSKRFSGEVYVASHDKSTALKQLIEKHNLTCTDSYAVGDSKSDAAMLELVENPIAFNPDENLFKIAQQNKWKIVIERKNVVYQLEPNEGTYKLVNHV